MNQINSTNIYQYAIKYSSIYINFINNLLFS